MSPGTDPADSIPPILKASTPVHESTTSNDTATATSVWSPAISYAGKVVLAPMVRISELPTRILSLKYGADIVWGPEIVDHALLAGGQPAERIVNEKLNTIDFVKKSKGHVIFRTLPTEKSQLIFQLGSAQPDTAVAAAKLVARDVAGIDLNCGCPKPFSTTGGMGSALLSDVDRLCAILRALIDEVGRPFNIGVSAKIRVLPDVDATDDMIRKICRTGIIGLTVHLRTIPMRPREPALRHRLARIVQVCKEEGVTLLANGDVNDRDEAEQLMAETGVSGIMIARGAEKNPSCFRGSKDGGPIDSLILARELVQTALDVDNPLPNTKYILMKMMIDKSKTQTFRNAQQAKTYPDLLDVLGMNKAPDQPQTSASLDTARQERHKRAEQKIAIAS
ncbi:tRNA-dihydrouridine synthase 2 [Savitreella phatthalungensis]